MGLVQGDVMIPRCPEEDESAMADESVANLGNVGSEVEGLQYTVEESPPWHLCILLGFQVSTAAHAQHDHCLIWVTSNNNID